jgi:hypothetical protein
VKGVQHQLGRVVTVICQAEEQQQLYMLYRETQAGAFVLEAGRWCCGLMRGKRGIWLRLATECAVHALWPAVGCGLVLLSGEASTGKSSCCFQKLVWLSLTGRHTLAPGAFVLRRSHSGFPPLCPQGTAAMHMVCSTSCTQCGTMMVGAGLALLCEQP